MSKLINNQMLNFSSGLTRLLLALCVCCQSAVSQLQRLLCRILGSAFRLPEAVSAAFSVSPPYLLSIYLFNLKQTKLFAFINA